MDKKFWKNKKVLVTGFEGFLGSNLTGKLISLGAAVWGLDIKVRRKETILTPNDYKRIKVIKGDVANSPLLKKIIRKNKIQIVFHLAAEALVGKGYDAPLKAFKSNIAGTWSVLEACRLAENLEAIIVASSDKAYGAHKNLPYKENFSLNGCYPYDVSKSCTDLLTNTYFHTYGLPVSITRCGNIFGPGDFNFSRLVPDAVRCLIRNKTLKIRSDGTFVRDYVYVEDIVAGYMRIAELLKKKNLSGEAFNFSYEKPLSVVHLLEEIDKLHFSSQKLNRQILNKARYEIKEQYLSAAKARRVLGWKPEFTLRSGLKKTIAWFYHNKKLQPQ
ncbi:MAG: NAD-dependent epimerase/dehydratase family protein [Candidatus Omnitrophica bacterium]|nr:NAD-dependent epimerase/dehydratase family protein [Candidatus Omnitrophota bacterium]